MSLSIEAKKEVQRFLAQGQKLMAVKYLKDTFQISLQDANALVEAVEREPTEGDSGTGQVDIPEQAVEAGPSSLDHEVKALLLVGKKIEAIRLVRSQMGLGLRESAMFVENIQQQVDPNYKRIEIGTGCLHGGSTLFAVIFGFIGILLLGIAGLIYYLQYTSIRDSDLVTGKVSGFNYSDGGSAPIVTYHINGREHKYESSTYSTPPAYEQDEQVQLFVNRSDAGDVVINTFTDRWLGITVAGGIGLFFGLFAFGFYALGKKMKS